MCFFTHLLQYYILVIKYNIYYYTLYYRESKDKWLKNTQPYLIISFSKDITFQKDK